MKKIKVLVSGNSIPFKRFIKNILEENASFDVALCAQTEFEVKKNIAQFMPDILVMNVDADFADIRITEEIMAYNPLPILLLSNHKLIKEYPESVFKALGMGALEVMPGPDITSTDKETRKFIETVKLLSRVKVITHLSGKKVKRSHPASAKREIIRNPQVIAVAASVGGPQALHYILSQLPADFFAAILVVQHISIGFAESLAQWLDKSSRLKVKVAEDQDKIVPGTVLVAPGNYHMLVEKNKRIKLEPPLTDREICPSADKLFDSVASVYAASSFGIVLTGMGQDGARGLKAIKSKGGKTIAQRKEDCVVFGMPEASINSGAVDFILPLKEIPKKIMGEECNHD